MENRPAKKPKSSPLTQPQVLWLCAAATGAFAPLTPWLPWWLSAISSLALIWRGFLLWRRITLPPIWIINILAVLGAIGVSMHYRTLLGKDAGVALLALFLALKLFETKTARDAYAVVFLGYFLVLSEFFYSQSIPVALAAIATVIVLTGALIALNHGQTREPVNEKTQLRGTLRLAAVMVAQAIPFMLVLFVLFPRISEPLWGLPQDSGRATSGLSDSMSIGSISQLSLSDAIAFRVHFNQNLPTRDTLYWRGPVLTKFDGHTWSIARPTIATTLPYQISGAAFDYEVTLEPHQQHWLFALELPGTLPAESVIGSDYELFTKKPVRERQRYAITSYPDTRAGADESSRVLGDAMALPNGVNPRARALGETLRREQQTSTRIAAAMLTRYRNEPFTYTLSPPQLGRNDIDDFLFSTRRGFCEHFAASFVFVMRAAGVPARVVTGYQGGEINPVDGYLEVRQMDAHAWAEIWVRGEGWRRIDPTAAIAPNRVEQSLAAAVSAGDPLPMLMRGDYSWLRAARYRIDAVVNGWNQWVLGYDARRQRDLLQALGMSSPDWQSMGAVLLVCFGLLMLGLTAWTLRQWQRTEPTRHHWQRFQRKLAQRGVKPQSWEGPRDYAKRAAAVLPRHVKEIDEIEALYETLRYRANQPGDALRKFKILIDAFAP
jgi:transglutaminase-like putative cysteine protease